MAQVCHQVNHEPAAVAAAVTIAAAVFSAASGILAMSGTFDTVFGTFDTVYGIVCSLCRQLWSMVGEVSLNGFATVGIAVAYAAGGTLHESTTVP